MHEKTILLSTLPISLYFSTEPLCCLWFLQIATFSMLPLIVLDQLVYPLIVLVVAYLLIIRLVIRLTANKLQCALSSKWDVLSLKSICDNYKAINLFYISTIFGCIPLLFGQLFVSPPESLPHLFPLLISCYSCVHFSLFFVYFNYRQLFSVANAKSDTLKHKLSISTKEKAISSKKHM